MTGKSADDPKRLPPYISYKTFGTLLEDLREHGLPSAIDRSVLTRFSGSNRTQLVSALRFLQLLSDDNKPTDALKALVKRWEGDRKAALRPVVEGAYKPIIAANLKTMTPKQLADAFKESYGPNDSVLVKCLSFFLRATTDAGIDLSPRILKRGRGWSTGARRKKANDTKPSGQPGEKHEKPGDPADAEHDMSMNDKWSKALLDKFPSFDPTWKPEVQAQWFSAFDQLMKKGGGS